MAAAKKGLGRGLSALIPDDDMEFLSRVARGDISLSVPLNSVPPKTKSELTGSGSSLQEGTLEALGLKKEPNTSIGPDLADASKLAQSAISPDWVAIDSIEANPYQPRRTFALEEMADLVSSVKEHGIIQPILVRPQAHGESGVQRYQLIAGERRWRAAQEAGLKQVPVVVRAVGDQQALELALIENVQRHDISVMDAARAYRRLGQEFNLSQEEIARRVGKSRPAISNTMRLLDLPAEAQTALEEGSISEGHGRAILLAPGEGARRAVFRLIVRDKLTVRDAEEASRRALATIEDASGGTATRLVDKDGSPKLSQTELRALRSTEEELSRVLGTRVRIKARAKGGHISVEYYTPEDLDLLLSRLRKNANG